MTKADWTLWAAIAAAIVALIELLTKHVGPAASNTNAPFTLSTGAPIFNMGGARAGSGIASPPLPAIRSGGCGCGDGFGDYAIARLPESIGNLQRGLPLSPAPVSIHAEFPLLTNGASA